MFWKRLFRAGALSFLRPGQNLQQPHVSRSQVFGGALLSTLFLVPVFPADLAAQASLATPIGPSQVLLGNCDDCFDEVSITDVFPTGINFGGTIYHSIFIGTNGYITLGHGNSGYDPQGIQGYTTGPIVAAQFDDLDPLKGGDVYYDQNAGSGWVVATWVDIEAYRSPPGSGGGTNSFQILLKRVVGDPQDFDIEIRYQALGWAKSGNINAWPTAGWSAGDEATYAELPQSGRSDFRDILTGSNVGEVGAYRWNVEGGVVQSTPTVNATTAASAITGTTAQSGGTVSSGGGLAVAARGVAYATSTGPTIADNTAAAGTGTGTFTAALSGLSTNTTYYIRAYATNSLGTAYGPERSFTTLDVDLPTVTTGEATAITSSTGTMAGNVSADGGAAVTARGIAWATDPGPTTDDNVEAAGSGTGAFEASVADLVPGKTYFYRAFATNSAGTAYGAERSFQALKLSQTIVFWGLEGRTYGEAPFDLEATATSGLPVTFVSSDPAVASISGTTVTLLGSGMVTISAEQAGDATYLAAASVPRTLEIGKRGVTGVFSVPREKVFDGSDRVTVLGRTLEGVLGPDVGQVVLAGGTGHLESPDVGPDRTVSLLGATLSGPRAGHYQIEGYINPMVSVIPGEPDHVTIEGPASTVAGDLEATLTLTVRDAFGNPAPVTMATTFGLETSAEPGSFEFGTGVSITLPARQSQTSFGYVTTAAVGGTHTITATWTSGSPLPGGEQGSHALMVAASELAGFTIEAAEGGPIPAQQIGVPFAVRITAVDEFGNPCVDFSGAVDLSAGPGLSNGSVATGFEDGILTSHSITMSTHGAFALTATEGTSGLTGASDVFRVYAPGSPIGVVVRASDQRPAPGSVITIEVEVTNWGLESAFEVTVPNPLASQQRLLGQSFVVEAGTHDLATGDWTIPELASGQKIVMTIQALVLEGAGTETQGKGGDQ